MAFKLNGTGANGTKFYLWQTADMGNGMKEWCYVTADTPAAVAVSGYLDGDDGDEDQDMAISMLSVGDRIWVYQVAAIDDTQTVQADMAGGITDISLHAVLINNGSYVDLSEDLLGATVTYTA
jgi:hypothetical protein